VVRLRCASRNGAHIAARRTQTQSSGQPGKAAPANGSLVRMLTGELDAASAAFEVGYESPSQFNREHRRFFGRPPIRDIKALRNDKVVAIATA